MNCNTPVLDGFPCPSPTPGVYPNPCPSSWWCHPAISSSLVPFSSCPQSLPASGSFPMSQLFAWGGQSIGVSASASALPINIQDWYPLGWTVSIFLQSNNHIYRQNLISVTERPVGQNIFKDCHLVAIGRRWLTVNSLNRWIQCILCAFPSCPQGIKCIKLSIATSRQPPLLSMQNTVTVSGPQRKNSI